MSNQNYSVEKQPASKPPHEVGEYNAHRAKTSPPAAAQFNKGAVTREQMQEAADRSRDHSAALSRKPIGPAGPASNFDSKPLNKD